jgi:hypothetical protein
MWENVYFWLWIHQEGMIILHREMEKGPLCKITMVGQICYNKEGEFTLTMIGDRACPINPLATHIVYAEGNMETIPKMIPIDIS